MVVTDAKDLKDGIAREGPMQNKPGEDGPFKLTSPNIDCGGVWVVRESHYTDLTNVEGAKKLYSVKKNIKFL